MKHTNDIEEIIFRSLTGIATRSELQELQLWRESDPDNERSYQLLISVWEKGSSEPVYANYLQLEERIIDEGFEEDISPSRWDINPTFYKIAAAVLLICITAFAAYRYTAPAEMTENTFEFVVTYNPAGQKSKITLPDNSVIFLNSESRVSYQKGFSDSIRHVLLEGEAYFNVEPNQERPFVVETGGINTQALGTSFNIRNYPEENSISVSLLTGKVKVTDTKVDNEVLLEPFEFVAFDKGTRVLKMKQMEEDIHSIWKDGIITFKSSNFKHVITTLERSYDVEFDTTDYQHTEWSYTGKFDNLSLEMVLTRIGYSEGFDYEMEGRTITLSQQD
jgi:ferric-dicitrate binding protein FerR (iron transport regulator)